jgi:hypothetical protein
MHVTLFVISQTRQTISAFWAVFTFGGSGPAITAHGSLDLEQEIQIQCQTISDELALRLR